MRAIFFRLALVGAMSAVAPLAHAQLLTHRDLSYSMAKTIAETAIDSCAAKGYAVSAVVVDRAGDVIVAMRADNAGPHTMENARRKAYTARSFRTSTTAYAKRFADNDPVVRQQVTLPNVIAIPGGLPVKLGDEVITGVGVSGSPGDRNGRSVRPARIGEESMDYRKKFFVDPAEKLRLRKLDPSYKGDHESEEAAKQETEHYRVKLAHQQALLYAQRKHSVLVVLQALDAGGKDGTVNHVFSALNPQGATVIGFKQPTPVELAHDFLWRVHPRAPGRGEVAIFNRSHYEDVLVTRVHKLIDKATWTARYKRIRQFETGLADNGTTILKFFLNISKEDQLARFAERLEDPKRNWKISESDYTERALWDDYIAAFEDAISATSTREAPWYIIPANHKWFRNLAVSQIMADTMEALDMAFPKPSVDLAEIQRKYHAAVAEGRERKR